MDDQQLRIFNAIASFVQDLNTGFGKKYKPVALYNRLVEKTAIRNVDAIKRHIASFKSFFACNPNYVKNKTLSGNTKITYTDRIYIDVGRITSKLDTAAQQHIHKHLVTIYSLLNIGTQDGIAALETLKNSTGAGADTEGDFNLNLPDTAEGNFIQDTLTEMTDQFSNMGEDANPMMLMANMMQSGFIPKFMGDLQTKFGSGEMDLKSLMSTVTSVISEATPQGTEETAQIRNFVNQATTMATGGQELPPDVQGPLNDILNAVGGQETPAEPSPTVQEVEAPEESEKDESN